MCLLCIMRKSWAANLPNEAGACFALKHRSTTTATARVHGWRKEELSAWRESGRRKLFFACGAVDKQDKQYRSCGRRSGGECPVAGPALAILLLAPFGAQPTSGQDRPMSASHHQDKTTSRH